jgi:tetratricopeptide (TPR) repeat protein
VELALLEDALAGGAASVVALVGPGGQGKTAIVQHWLERHRSPEPEGVFLWSFYRGKEADSCLRALYAYAADLAALPDVSASYCVDHLLPILRGGRWAVVLDGTEVVQYEDGPWRGRFVHPELGRLLEEAASGPLPGLVVLTTRFELPTLARRRHARLVSLATLDPQSARSLLAGVGVRGESDDLDAAADVAGRHAKAVELLGTFLVRFHAGDARRCHDLPGLPSTAGLSDEEQHVARILAAYRDALATESRDILALTVAFREPPTEERLLEYLASESVRALLHDIRGRDYPPFASRPAGWLAARLQELIDLRLLERVGRVGPASGDAERVLDAHPLVRRGFEEGTAGMQAGARARAGFLRGRPDRRRPATLEEVREEVELFHAYCEAGLWAEADSVFVALENPKHRFLAPALERDLLVCFFPHRDWRPPPLWPGFGRYRSLAIALEMLGQFNEAIEAYREADAALRGDALLALGRLGPILGQTRVQPAWQTLWNAYRCHALALAGRPDEALAVVRGLVPVDVYEWAHVFECLLRLGRLDLLDLRSVLWQQPLGEEHRWAELARRRMRADYLRLTGQVEGTFPELGKEYEELAEAYDRGGLPLERGLVRISRGRWLLAGGETAAASAIAQDVLDLSRRHQLRILEADAWDLIAAAGDPAAEADAVTQRDRLRQESGYAGPARP